MRKWVQDHLVRAIEWYRREVSPQLPPGTCLFEPTCSAYGLEAVRRHGPWRGAWLAAWRILRCNPWNRNVDAHDPVPR